MTEDFAGSHERVSRRSVLASSAASITFATAGCLDTMQALLDDSDGALSLTLLTVPDDNDRQTVQLARKLEANLEAVGVDVTLEFQSRTELLRSVLLDHDFHVYVGRYPIGTDPDVYYELLHSSYANETGWQNPYGYADLQVDDLLEEQRRLAGSERRATVDELVETVAQDVPFIPICVPDDYRAYAPDEFDGWEGTYVRTGLEYLGLDPIGGDDQLTAVVTDSRPSRNVNPFAPEYRNDGSFVNLIYDSLGIDVDGEIVPWLAESWEWIEDDRMMEVTLREDLTFHDGEVLTAEDVAFTYRFLEDTSDGRADTPIAPPCYRRQGSIPERVITLNDRTLWIDVDVASEVAERAFTAPVLPEHVWVDLLEDVDEFPSHQGAWGLLESDDDELLVGSGPFELEEQTADESLTFARFDDHFTLREAVDLPEPTVEELDVPVDPGSASAVEQVARGSADVTASRLETHVLDDTRDRSEVALLEAPPGSCYQVGFNARRMPCSNPRFRRLVSRLLDREWLIEEVFDGHARPTMVPVTESWTPDSLAWDGEDPITPFLGTDGDLDAEAAREAFVDAGFQYDEDGTLLVRG